MQRWVVSRLSTHFIVLFSNLNSTPHRNRNARVQIGCIAQTCFNFSTSSARVSDGDFDALHSTMRGQGYSKELTFSKVPQDIQATDKFSKIEGNCNHQIGDNVSRKDRMKFLINTLSDLKDSKEVVYGALDAWVAWEQNFPIASLKRILQVLEKDQQWHRVIQVIKWILSKGQGTTMGTYQQLIRALDKDRRAEEAHELWMKKIGDDLHSVPWRFCNLMISIYFRNNMLERLVKLFKGLEAFDRKPPDKAIVQKVADAYEMLGSVEDKQRILDKYNYLFSESHEGCHKKFRKASSKTKLKERNNRTDPAQAQTLEMNSNPE